MMLPRAAKTLRLKAKQSYALNLADLVATNYIKGAKYKLFSNRSNDGTHAEQSAQHYAEYAEQIVRAYLGRLPGNRLQGRVAEVGVGPSSGPALLMLVAGADSVDLPDRYTNHLPAGLQRQVDALLAERNADLRRLLTESSSRGAGISARIQRYSGPGAQAERFFLFESASLSGARTLAALLQPHTLIIVFWCAKQGMVEDRSR